MPFPWVNLRHGVLANESVFETNTAAVGSFTIEMGLLSRLTGKALKIMYLLWTPGMCLLMVALKPFPLVLDPGTGATPCMEPCGCIWEAARAGRLSFVLGANPALHACSGMRTPLDSLRRLWA